MGSKNVILITGANSGVGFDTTRALAAASPSNHVIMGCRSLEKGGKAFRELQNMDLPGRLSLVQIDVTNDASIKSAAAEVEKQFGVLDVLINNAGIVVKDTGNRRADLLDTYSTNAAGPLIVTESFTPLLKLSADPRIINVTSIMGSLELRTDSTLPTYNIYDEAYRMSKAALNMATLHGQAANRNWGAKFWIFCPGYVVTNLTGEADRQLRIDTGADPSTTSAQGILEIVQGNRDDEVGMFLGRQGLRHPW